MVAATPRPRRRIRFINPNAALTNITMPELIRKMTFTRKAIFAPTGLTICAAIMPQHWDSEVVDECTMESPHVPKADVDVVGITAMTTQARRMYELADAYRKLGVTVVLGGIHPSAMPEDAAPHADAVCKGDAESTLPNLIADWEKAADAGQDPRAGLKPLYDWSKYPETAIATPRKDLLDPREYLIANPIQTTRGCPHTCSFCTTPGVFGRKFRMRKISDIVDEIKEAKERHKSWCFIFADDDFGGNHKWALEMCNALKPLKVAWASQCDILISNKPELLKAMRESGCAGLILGLESRKQGTLTEAGKRFVKAETYEWRIRRIQSHGISLWGAFIFGLDTDRWQDLMFTTRWAQRMNLAMSCYPILTPYPGTDFFKQYEREGRLRTREWERYNGASVVFEPKQMTTKQLRHAQMAAFAEFYSPRSALRRLGLFPLKKRAWVANLAIWQGIRHYYRKRRRAVPRFVDFDNPTSSAWNYPDESWAMQRIDSLPGRNGGIHTSNADACACPNLDALAATAVANSDPFAQAARALAGLSTAGVR
jgi:radical SAM superfamily enzyme YgiQ (UPF0313 family)